MGNDRVAKPVFFIAGFASCFLGTGVPMTGPPEPSFYGGRKI